MDKSYTVSNWLQMFGFVVLEVKDEKWRAVERRWNWFGGGERWRRRLVTTAGFWQMFFYSFTFQLLVVVVSFWCSIADHNDWSQKGQHSSRSWQLPLLLQTGKWWDHSHWNDCSVQCASCSGVQSVITCHRLISPAASLTSCGRVASQT